MFQTYQGEVPPLLRMACVRCALTGADTAAVFLVTASSGHGLAACAEHRVLTTTVLASLVPGDDQTLRLMFALTAMQRWNAPERRPAAVPPRLLALQDQAQAAAQAAGPRDGDKLMAALGAFGIPSWLAEDSGVSYVLAGVDLTRDEGEAHTGPKVFLYSGESADLAPADHAEPWACALYDGEGEFVDVLFTAQDGLGLDAECAHAALCLAVWLDAFGQDYPRG